VLSLLLAALYDQEPLLIFRVGKHLVYKMRTIKFSVIFKSSIRLNLLFFIFFSEILVSPPAISGEHNSSIPKIASKEAMEFAHAFGYAHGMQEKMRTPELRDTSPAFARIAAMPESELEEKLAEVYDVIASPDELSEVSKLIKTSGGKILARDYEVIVKKYGSDIQAYSDSLPILLRASVVEASHTPGWGAVRRIGRDARFFGLVLQRVMVSN